MVAACVTTLLIPIGPLFFVHLSFRFAECNRWSSGSRGSYSVYDNQVSHSL
jgi:hypothetical protein